ncbi:hypothetical protein [Anaerorhabdus sp.]|uniref:hypothetical protein n=1 Tax=Anaerorhabdus sp. TaxID=1872524 RepID=UPI002FC948A7
MPKIQFNLKDCCMNCAEHNIEVTTTTVSEINNLQHDRASKIQCSHRDSCELFNRGTSAMESSYSDERTINEIVEETIDETDSEKDAYL